MAGSRNYFVYEKKIVEIVPAASMSAYIQVVSFIPNTHIQGKIHTSKSPPPFFHPSIFSKPPVNAFTETFDQSKEGHQTDF